MPESRAGYVVRAVFHTVCCYNCGQWERLQGNKEYAIEAFRISGWGKSGGKWICPDCKLNGVKIWRADNDEKY